MHTDKSLRTAAKMVRSPGVGVLFLAAGWIAFQQTAGWGQQRPASGDTPVPVRKVKDAGPKPSPSPAPAAPADDSQRILDALSGGFHGGPGSGPLVHNFGAGLSGGGFTSPQRFSIRIDPNTPVSSLLPPPPVVPAPRPPWMVMHLQHVPEVRFEKETPIPTLPDKALENKTDAEKAKIKDDFAQSVRQNAIAHAAHTLAKINHANRKGTDRFVQLLADHRPDMQGLPFIMGDACRMSQPVSRQFIQEVHRIKPGGFGGSFGGSFGGGFAPGLGTIENKPEPPKPSSDDISRAKVAVLMQVWAPDPGRKQELVKELAAIDHVDATRALARLTVYSFEKDLREAALAILKNRPEETFDQIIVEALRYPWPAVAQNAADAVVKLKRKDLAAHLVSMLEEPDPRAPAFRDQCVPTVREVVRLNHHHNCITCHQPATSDDTFNKTGFSTDFLSAPVTIHGPDPRPQPFGYGFGGPSISPDIFVRTDVTYLRQDFSLMQRNPDPQTGPLVQRFDFLVRTRAVTLRDVDDYQAWLKGQGTSYRSPYHTTAVTALRQLTGRNAAATAAAWRAQLDLK